MRQLSVVTGFALAAAVWVPCRAQDDAPAPIDAVTAQARIAAAMRERRELQRQYADIRRRIERSDALNDLRRAAAEASKAVAAAEKDNAGIAEAREAERAAAAAVRKAEQASLAANPDAAALLRRREELEDSRAASSLQAAVAQLKLTHKDSPVSRTLAKDEKLAALRRRAYGMRDRDAQTEARKAYNDARQAAMAKMPQAKVLLDDIETAKAAMAEADKAAREVGLKLLQLRREIGRDKESAALAAARERLRAANRAVQDAYNTPALKALIEARDKAHRALYQKVRELVAADKDAAAVSAKLREIEKRIRDLADKARPKRSPKRRRRPEPQA